MKACKHLDHSDTYSDTCTLKELDGLSCKVLYWERGAAFVQTPDDQTDNPRDVQFCGQGRGRINEIFACYNGEMHCYDAD